MPRFADIFSKPVHIAPLVTFRIFFGAAIAFSTARFIMLGWVEDHYINPIFHFKFYGFEWVDVFSPFWMYAIHAIMIAAALFVAIGFYYRLASIVLFLTFTYTELIDLAYYLNHYYFVSLTCLLLIFAPANRFFSIDAERKPPIKLPTIPRVWIIIFQLQLAIVYIYAGVAKINYSWLMEALPMKIWLPANDKLPLIGALFTWEVTPYLFSWIGMIYDCTIVFFLLWNRTRLWAYLAVITFHILTGVLFQIGVFPLVMIGATLIFFSEGWHVKLLKRLSSVFGANTHLHIEYKSTIKPASQLLMIFFAAYILFQIIFPWRYLLYPGDIFWTEEGYRFSWRVMLMEKAGTATFYVKDSKSGREGIVVNSEFLNAHQEKQMSMQPDMILQFAHFLDKHYENKGVTSPEVRAEVYVTLNARPSQLLIDPHVDLSAIEDGWKPKTWILPNTQR
jgi:hypothetical protein